MNNQNDKTMEMITLERTYVYDRWLRLLHAWIGLCTLLLITTGLYASNLEPGADQAAVWALHILAGKLLIVGFIGRFIWGVIGPRWAKLSEFWHMKDWVQLLTTRRYKFDGQKLGHEPMASLAYLGFYGLTVGMIITGMIIAGVIHGRGPLARIIFDDLDYQSLSLLFHEWGAWLIVSFVGLHVAALALHERIDNLPLAQAMISGFQYKKTKETKK